MKEDNLYNYVKETNERTHIIINSCETQEQLTSASRYTRLLWDRWKEKITHKGKIDVVDGDLLITLMGQHHKRILRKEIEIETLNNH
tara:strand:- start:648 stop:908 length:261 start_codon:yes stop_codon:yes gene_type:complete